MRTSFERVIHLLDRTPRGLIEFGDLVAAVDELRLEVLEHAREVGRTPSTLRALERDSTRSRDGDPFQNRAIAMTKALDQDLASLVEREGTVRRVFGRGYRDEFDPIAHRVAELRVSLVENRQRGSRAANAECLEIALQARLLLRDVTSLPKERVVYLACAAVTHGLIVLSMIHDPYGDEAAA